MAVDQIDPLDDIRAVGESAQAVIANPKSGREWIIFGIAVVGIFTSFDDSFHAFRRGGRRHKKHHSDGDGGGGGGNPKKRKDGDGPDGGDGVESGNLDHVAPKSVKPQLGSLNNLHARQYYNSKLPTLRRVIARMEGAGASRQAIAERVSHLRNVLKTRVRGMMADRAIADSLPPLRSYQYYVDKYRAQGLAGDALHNRIIEGALTPNPGVNAKFGIK